MRSLYASEWMRLNGFARVESSPENPTAPRFVRRARESNSGRRLGGSRLKSRRLRSRRLYSRVRTLRLQVVQEGTFVGVHAPYNKPGTALLIAPPPVSECAMYAANRPNTS